MAELQFSIDAEAFKKAVADVFKKEGKKYPVQGFRKGKAPKALIEKMYGADVFTYDAINELFPETFEAAVKEAGVEPVGRPEVTVDSASEAEGATLTVKVAVKPEVKVGSYNGLTVEKTVHTVTDEAVDAELKRVQERNARELTRELSRFARNTVDALKATRELKQYGVEVYFVNDGIWTMDGDGEVRLTIMASIAQDESRKTSERVKAGQKISRENGVLYGNGNVLGYDLDKVNKTYTINEEQADTVRRVYELYANGYGETAVANMLMAEGRKDGGGGCTWTASKVSRVLRKPVYKGYKAYNQSHVKDYLSQERIYHCERDYSLVKGDFPPIVSEKLWDTCFAIRKNRAAHNVDKEGRTYGFGTGFPQNKWAKVLYCECGARYQCEGHDKRRNGRSDVRLMCSATKKLSKRVRDEKGFGVPCPLPYTWDWKMEMIAKKMYQTIWVTHNDDLRKLGEELNEYLRNNTESPEVISLKKQLEDLNGEMDKLVQGRAQSRISLAEFMKMSTQVNEKVMATEKALQEAEQQNSAEEQLDLEKLEASLCDSADFSGGEINEYFLDVYVRRIIKSGERYIWLLSLTEKIKPKPPETKEKPRIQQIRTYKAGELVNPETTPDIVEQKKEIGRASCRERV